MKKLTTARLLMIATILLVIAFQVYWLKKLYREEEGNFKKSIDLIFRESLYNLQVERFKKGPALFHKMPDDNLFMTDMLSTLKKDVQLKDDSIEAKVVISLKRDDGDLEEHASLGLRPGGDTVYYVKTAKGDSLPSPMANFLKDLRNVNDSIPIKKIDSLYKSLLAREGITVGYRLQSFHNDKKDSLFALYATRKVPVGLASPVYYQAIFDDAGIYLLRKISTQLFLSFLLVVLTLISFVFIYRNLLAQKRLTQVKNEFINNITHELKTPIATVTVAIEALRNFGGLEDPQRTKEYLHISALELQRLGLLVDKVLKLSMFEDNRIVLQKDSFSLLQLAGEVMDSMKLQFEKQQAETELLSTGENFMIIADRLHIASVIYNLLDNALKYCSGKPRISVNVIDCVNYLELQVTDTGMGIPETYRRKIFDQFFRVPDGDRHNIKGYGLGLSYVNHIVQRHQGFVEVKSEVGRGSTFIVRLPFEEAGVVHYDQNRKVIRKSVSLKRSPSKKSIN